MSDEKLYLEATGEVNSDNKDAALWSKSLALAEGDQEIAKYKYIKLRVEQLASLTAPTNHKENIVKAKDPENEFKRRYMPVSEFSKIKSIDEPKVIEMIKDGFYSGQIKNDQWYIDRSEIGGEEDKSKTSHGSSKAQNKNQLEYMPVEEFAEIKRMNAEKVIAMIKDGFYIGQIDNDKWYISSQELDGDSNSNKTSSNDQKSKIAAGFLALLLGGLGAHKFYLGAWGWGIVYILLVWTWVPAIISIIEAIRYFTLNDEEFKQKASAMKEPMSFLW